MGEILILYQLGQLEAAAAVKVLTVHRLRVRVVHIQAMVAVMVARVRKAVTTAAVAREDTLETEATLALMVLGVRQAQVAAVVAVWVLGVQTTAEPAVEE
jgi:hypothetical protein